MRPPIADEQQQQQQQHFPFLDLPEELQTEIVLELPWQQSIQFGRVSKHCHSLLEENSFWESLYRRLVGEKPIASVSAPTNAREFKLVMGQGSLRQFQPRLLFNMQVDSPMSRVHMAEDWILATNWNSKLYGVKTADAVQERDRESTAVVATAEPEATWTYKHKSGLKTVSRWGDICCVGCDNQRVYYHNVHDGTSLCAKPEHFHQEWIFGCDMDAGKSITGCRKSIIGVVDVDTFQPTNVYGERSMPGSGACYTAQWVPGSGATLAYAGNCNHVVMIDTRVSTPIPYTQNGDTSSAIRVVRSAGNYLTIANGTPASSVQLMDNRKPYSGSTSSSSSSSSSYDTPTLLDTAAPPDQAQYGNLCSCLFHPEFRFVCTGAGDGVFRLYDMLADNTLQQLVSYRMHKVTILYMGATQNYLATVSRDHSLKVWQFNGTEVGSTLQQNTLDVRNG